MNRRTLKKMSLPMVPEQPKTHKVSKARLRSRSWKSSETSCKPGNSTAGSKKTGEQRSVQVLDGFLLLEASNVDLPEDATRADLSQRNIQVVMAKDFAFFANLCYLDLGGNKVNMDDLVGLRNLEDLRLPCNGIVTFGAEWREEEVVFPYMTKLDLSYNKIAPLVWKALAKIPRLRELDLSCNQIDEVPEVAQGMRALEILNLTENGIGADKCLENLSKIPALQRLNMEKNRVVTVPPAVEFKKLNWLDLSDNRVECDQDIVALISNAKNLSTLILINNPIETFRFSKVLGHHSTEDSLVTLNQSTHKSSVNEFHQNRQIVNLVSDSSLTHLKSNSAKGYKKLRLEDEPLPSQEKPALEDKPKPDTHQHSRPRSAEGYKPSGFFMTGLEAEAHSSLRSTEEATQGDERRNMEEVIKEKKEADWRAKLSTAYLYKELGIEEHPKCKRDASKLQAAIKMLRYTLKNPLTDTKLVESGKEEWHFQKPTTGYKLRTKDRKRHPFKPILKDEPKHTVSITEEDDPEKEAIALGKLQKVLNDIDAEMAREAKKEQISEEKAMENLINTVNNVVETYGD